MRYTFRTTILELFSVNLSCPPLRGSRFVLPVTRTPCLPVLLRTRRPEASVPPRPSHRIRGPPAPRDPKTRGVRPSPAVIPNKGELSRELVNEHRVSTTTTKTGDRRVSFTHDQVPRVRDSPSRPSPDRRQAPNEGHHDGDGRDGRRCTQRLSLTFLGDWVFVGGLTAQDAVQLPESPQDRRRDTLHSDTVGQEIGLKPTNKKPVTESRVTTTWSSVGTCDSYDTLWVRPRFPTLESRTPTSRAPGSPVKGSPTELTQDSQKVPRLVSGKNLYTKCVRYTGNRKVGDCPLSFSTSKTISSQIVKNENI